MIKHASAMNGKTCLITGASSGHGKALAKTLALQGATVVLACRDAARAEQARADILEAAPGASLEVLALDLSSLRSVHEAADRVLDRHPKLDVLVNNAGAWWQDRRTSPDGIELVWATNVISPLLLTHRLIGPLEASGCGRILNVASTFAGGLDVNDVEFALRPYDGLKAYVASKQAVRMLTWSWAERLVDRPVVANALCPGFMATKLGRNAPVGFRLMLILTRPLQASPERGADTAAWLASSDECQGLNGTFVVRRLPVPCQFRDPEAMSRLNDLCVRYLQLPSGF
jgi:NAD(P)-dependent dehydrogenase (short-subunit alcohol dehydrogenase family)